MICIVDYGIGNLLSILNMVRKAGFDAVISGDKEVIYKSSKIILPGVGAFDTAMKVLIQSGLDKVLKEVSTCNDVTILGICLGMQLLADGSEEGAIAGLGLIPGRVKKFSFSNDRLKVPHMGWNTVFPVVDSILFSKGNSYRYYFVHSYHYVCDSIEHILATTNYGYDFTCAVNKRNIYGVQFHPEKSHQFGIELFRGFLDGELC